MTKCYSYIRFSSKRQMDGFSLERQMKKAEKWVAANPDLKLELDTELNFRDLGVSAFRGANVKEGELGEFLKAVEEGLVPSGSFLIVENLDRVSRLPFKKAARVLEDICEKDINVVTLSDNTIYTKDSDLADYIRAALEFERAHRESVRKSELSNANWKQLRHNASNGKIMSKNIVSWLRVEDNKFVEIKDKADTVRKIINLFLAGKGCTGIATLFNVDGVEPLKNGKVWLPRSIHSILTNPAICGRYEMGDKSRQEKEPPIEGYYPALISVDQFNEIKLLLNKGNVKQRDPIANPVAGICVCSVCGAKMTRYKTKSHGERLICSAGKVKKCNGGYQSIALHYVYDRLKFRVKHPKFYPDNWTDNQEVIKQLGMALDILRLKIDNVVEAIVDEGNTSPALRASLFKLETEKANTETKLDEETTKAIQSGKKAVENRLKRVNIAIEEGDIEVVNAIFRQLFDKVVVDVKERKINVVWEA